MSDYKNWVQSIFDRASPNYNSCSFFQYFGKNLVQIAKVSEGTSALDIATGRGAILFPLAKAIGPSGKVIGIDISNQMLKETSNEVQERKIDWINLQQMDAEHLLFPDNFFDFVFCGFALFFFPSIEQALAECNRVLKPEGTLAVSLWGKKSELSSWIKEELKLLSNEKSLKASPINDKNSLKLLLEKSQFENVQILEKEKVFFHKTPEDWWQSLWYHGTRAPLENLSSKQLESLHDKAIKKAKTFDKGHGVEEKLQVFYGLAQK